LREPGRRDQEKAMSNEQTRDILEHAQQFHRQVSEYYDRLGGQTDKQRIKMLLYYLSRHEKHLAESLAEFEHSAPQSVLNTCFKVGHELKTFDVIKRSHVTPDMSVDDVIELGLEFDNCLIAVYQDLAQEAPDEKVRSVFQNLLEMEQKEKQQLVRNAQRVMDF
jgi:rubrerythrin